jgi:H+/Cl- antiporter ClcA
MTQLFNPREHLRSFLEVANLSLLVIPVGLLSGSASAFFLWVLEHATETRFEHPWLFWLLPLGGIVISMLYHYFGKSAEGGNNLILEQIHTPGGGVPARMAPLVLLGTVLTHLFGGSAGREGTAVQMGGSLADAYRRVFRISAAHQRLLLMAGVAAGFGSVFGTPVTGAVFAMEVLVIGRIQYEALIPVLIASVVADWTCAAWGIHHTSYHIAIDAGERLNPYLLLWAGLGGITFGLAGRLFSELVHGLQNFWKKSIRLFWLRPVVGALVVIALVYLIGTRDYLGLGVSNPEPNAITVLSSFHAGGATPWSWWWKLLFTAVTLSCGFKGGEVTPLFFIGAALGNAVGTLAGVPIDLMAGLGFIAVFAGAANTPLACTLMGVELFGSHYAPHFALACFVAYYFSGHTGIYVSQIIGVPKRGTGDGQSRGLSLKEAQASLHQHSKADVSQPSVTSEN